MRGNERLGTVSGEGEHYITVGDAGGDEDGRQLHDDALALLRRRVRVLVLPDGSPHGRHLGGNGDGSAIGDGGGGRYGGCARGGPLSFCSSE